MGNRRVIIAVICVILAAAILTLGCFTPAQEYVLKGAGLITGGQYDEAIVLFNKAIDLDPNFAEAYQLRGIAFHAKQDYDKAIVDFTKAIEIEPTYADAYQCRGDAYDKKGEKGKAEADWAKAKELGHK